MKLNSGKIYKVTKRIIAVPEHLINLPDNINHSITLEKDKMFIFIEEVKKDLSTFSKIVVDDKVLVTYNGYYLRDRVVEMVPKKNVCI